MDESEKRRARRRCPPSAYVPAVSANEASGHGFRNHERPGASTAARHEIVTAGPGLLAPEAEVAGRWPLGRQMQELSSAWVPRVSDRGRGLMPNGNGRSESIWVVGQWIVVKVHARLVAASEMLSTS
jgi:hypothetical protein